MSKIIVETRSAAAVAYEEALLEENRDLVEGEAVLLDAPKAPKLETETDRYVMARMLSTTREVLSGKRSKGDKAATEAATTTAALGTSYVPQMLGMIRQIYPRLIGKDLVGIQPLDRPSGKVFTLTITRSDGTDPSDHSSWDTYRSYSDHTAGENADIEEDMEFSITDADVNVGDPQKLAVGASLESIQDLRAYHNLDGNVILQGAATDEIARNIDAKLVRMVRTAAIANKTITFGKNAETGYTADEWRKRLQRAILLANNHIYKARGVDATWLVCGADAALELEDLREWKPSAFSGEVASMGLEGIGTLNSRFNVYRSRYLSANEIIVGRKGTSILDAGAYWLPYVPLFVSDLIFNVNKQKFERSFMSRYATHVSSNQYFARIVIDDEATGIS